MGKYFLGYRKYKHELVNEPKKKQSNIEIKQRENPQLKQSNQINCRTIAPHKCGTRIGIKQCDVILTNEQTSLAKKSIFERENMQTEYKVLGYRTDICFHNCKISIEIDENGYSDRNIEYEIKKSKSQYKKNLVAGPDKEDFDISEAFSMKYLDTSNSRLNNFDI